MMKNKKTPHTKTPKLLGTEHEGVIVSLFGADAEIEDTHGNLIRGHLRKNAEPVITGDRVLWHPEQDGSGSVITHLPRKSLLYRPENKHKIKLIAANIDALIIACAPHTSFSEDMIDRYIVAAEILKITPVILLNKADLLKPQEKAHMADCLAVYQNLGYQVIFSSIVTHDGLGELHDFLENKTCVFVGASGVGKSSIIGALTESNSVRVGEVSASTGLGKHTTTNTRLYHLKQGGNVIDSPGVREFGLWHASKEEVLNAFKDFKPYLHSCQFRDCQHEKEPNCALQQALAENKINARRFASYQKITDELTSMDRHSHHRRDSR